MQGSDKLNLPLSSKDLLHSVLSCQRRASDPGSSVWVAASAGSGKTKVLTDRLLRLLLAGAPLEGILCLTFTRAAASEMRHRLFKVLETWCEASSEVLCEHLTLLLGHSPSALCIQCAQNLFYHVVDHQDRLRIMTLHGFCQGVLQKFPLEGGCHPHFSVLTDVDAKQAQEHIFLELLQEKTLKKPMQTVLESMALERLHDFLRAAYQEPWLSLETFQSVLNLKTSAVSPFVLNSDLIESLVHLQIGSAEDQKRGRFLQEYHEKRLSFTDIHGVFLTQDYEIKSKLVTKKVLDKAPHLEYLLRAEAQSYLEHARLHDGWRLLQVHEAFREIKDFFYAQYQDLKKRQGMLDFVDIMEKTLSLLRDPALGPWVLFHMTEKLEHVLIDEAQDTSPLQWALTLKITEDFFAGMTHRDRDPTLFVVGDFKQSIYGFQGARPELFQSMKTFYQQQITGGQGSFDGVELDVSFRSSPEILQCVDQVFSVPSFQRGIASPMRHRSFRVDSQGSVCRWPLMIADKDEDGSLACAQKIAGFIAKTLVDGYDTGSNRISVRPSDFLILVQRRHRFLYQLIRALKKQGVPVMGADRFLLKDQLAIQDLLALCRFLLLPSDTFSLVSVLLSPLGGWTFSQTMQFQERCQKTSLWDFIKEESSVLWLKDLLKKTDHVPVSHVIFEVLEKYHGRVKIFDRLGQEGLDAVNEFIECLVRFEQSHETSLQAFVEWFDHTDLEVKRDVAQNPRDEVRLMTVHGAKGLQAPIVILPDTIRLPDQPSLLLTCEDGSFLSVGHSNLHPGMQVLKDCYKERERAEYQRLLYVALTRAENHLIIAGWHDKAQGPVGSWYQATEAWIPETEPEISRENVKELKINTIVKKPAFMEADVPFESRESLAVKTATTGEGDDVYDLKAAARGELVHKALENYMRVRQLSPLIASLLKNSSIKAALDLGQAEVPLVGTYEGDFYSVRLDCLIVQEESVHIIDFKTGKRPTSGVPQIYQDQLQLYQKLTQGVFPYKKIRTSILWTDEALLENVCF